MKYSKVSWTRAAGFAALGLAGYSCFVAAPAFAQRGFGETRRIYPGAETILRNHGGPGVGVGVSHRGAGVVIVNGGPCYVPRYYGGYGGYAYGYGGYGGGFGFGFSAGGVSFGYQQGFGYAPPPNYVVVQPVVVDGGRSYSQYYDDSNGGYNAGPVVRSAPRYDSDPATVDSQPARRTPPSTDVRAGDDDYYLTRRPAPSESRRSAQSEKAAAPIEKAPGLAQAVRDIEEAFRSNNISLLEKHLDQNDKLTLSSEGRSRKTLTVATYLEMTKDAFTSIKTVKYSLDSVEPASGGAWMAYGKHVLSGDNGAEQTFNVSFVLKRKTDKEGDWWAITEVMADPAK